jgi:hypothetical protein
LIFAGQKLQNINESVFCVKKASGFLAFNQDFGPEVKQNSGRIPVYPSLSLVAMELDSTGL